MINPEAVIKPDITGCERKFVIKPSLNIPIKSKIKPDITANKIAIDTNSELPGCANLLAAVKVINAITATGPTASVFDVPNIE